VHFLDNYTSPDPKGIKASLFQNQLDNSNILDLPVPPVNTTIIFGKHIDTKSAYYINTRFKMEVYLRENTYYSSGDSVVNTYSSVIPGLKWFYDLKSNNSSNVSINFVEYCSLLNQENQFKLEKNSSEDKIYTAIGCSCLNKDNQFILDNINKDTDQCSHATYISDPTLIDYVFKLTSRNPTYKYKKQYKESIHNALKDLTGKKVNWVKNCNDLLVNK